MVKSMYAGIAGLKSHQSKMDVIGNNIANVNTWGYKSGSASFKESLYSTIAASSAGNNENGGTNPSQIGYGSQLSSVDLSFVNGSYAPTDSPTDAMIDGPGFFLVGPKPDNGEGIGLTGGNNFITNTTPVKLNPATAGTTIVNVDSLNIIAGTTVQFGDKKYMFVDHEGNPDTIPDGYEEIVIPVKDAAVVPPVIDKDGLYANIIERMEEAFENELDGDTAGSIVSDIAKGTITITTAVPEAGDGTDPDFIPVIKFPRSTNTDQADLVSGLNLTRVGKFVLDGDGYLVDPMGNVVYGYAGETNADGKFIPNVGDLVPIRIPLKDEGDPDSEIMDFTNVRLDKTGNLIGTNGETEKPMVIGQVAVSTVTNPNGLEKTQGPYYKIVNNTGTTIINSPGLGGVGALTPNGLEMANVDLAKEFSEMITTQRGFQANTRIITVTDEMLQELVNLKR